MAGGEPAVPLRGFQRELARPPLGDAHDRWVRGGPSYALPDDRLRISCALDPFHNALEEVRP